MSHLAFPRFAFHASDFPHLLSRPDFCYSCSISLVDPAAVISEVAASAFPCFLKFYPSCLSIAVPPCKVVFEVAFQQRGIEEDGLAA